MFEWRIMTNLPQHFENMGLTLERVEAELAQLAARARSESYDADEAARLGGVAQILALRAVVIARDAMKLSARLDGMRSGSPAPQRIKQ